MAPLSDKDLEIEIATMLRVGVVLSALLVGAGGVLYLRGKGMIIPDYAHFHATATPLRSVGGVLRGVAGFDPASIIQLGILALIATPVARVVLSATGFVRQRDWLYVSISVAVLLILFYSLVAGAR